METISFIITFCLISMISWGQNIDEIIRRADEKFRGESSKSKLTMIIERPTWSREISMKSWTLGNEYSMIYITTPAKEEGQVFLKRENQMWNWVPTIERMIKIPPSMMMQSWMGSDFTNDDLVNASSLVEDYNNELLGEDTIRSFDCYKIKLIPKTDAPVVWGKIIMWVSKEKYHWLRGEYYDEEGNLVNTEIMKDIKKMDDREIPTRLEMLPADEKGHKTVLVFEKIDFNINITESFFSQQNMRRVR
jgi:outer membrane lipoprotein-sorting protein